MEGLLKYIRERGGVVHKNVQDGKTPTPEQLHKFIRETVVQLKALSKEAPDQVRMKLMLPWAPNWDYDRNAPSQAEEHGIDAPKLLDILKRIKDSLSEAPQARPASKGKGKGRTAGAPAPEEEEEEKRAPKYTGPPGEELVPIKMEHIGRIVGPKGATLKLIQEGSDCKLDVQQDAVQIVGPSDGIPVAVQAIKELCEKGFCGLSYGDDFQEQGMQIHPVYFSELIGKEGKIIQAIKKELRVELSIPKTPPNAKVREMTKKLKVGFAGKKPDVEKAKEVVSDILMYYHHPITHPDVVHQTMPVEPHQTRFIIGKGGCEMKHIQNSYRVKVYIPNEHSVNPDLVVVGESKNVEQACKYIENAIYAAENRPTGGRGATEKGEDFWGDEEAEPWMDQYMYKRR